MEESMTTKKNSWIAHLVLGLGLAGILFKYYFVFLLVLATYLSIKLINRY